jgi:spore maturation protein A
MLNYIWAGLIIASLLFALGHDYSDLRDDTYRNRAPLPVTVQLPEGYDPAEPESPATLLIEPATYQAHYGVEATPAEKYPGTVVHTERGVEWRFNAGTTLPEPLATMRSVLYGENPMRGQLVGFEQRDGVATAQLTFAPVRFIKLKAISEAAVNSVRNAVNLVIGLIGLLALWLGLMRIAEASGLIAVLVHVTQPLLRLIFPSIPKDHPALGMIALNVSANVLGLGNAATPLGIKAMEELQKLNRSSDTATDPMVMLLAINTASVQLLPPATLVALMGMRVGEVYIPIILVTAISLAIAITVTLLLGRLPMYRRTNPDIAPATVLPANEEGA